MIFFLQSNHYVTYVFSEHSRHPKKDNKNNKNTEFMNLMGYDKNSTFKIKLF